MQYEFSQREKVEDMILMCLNCFERSALTRLKSMIRDTAVLRSRTMIIWPKSLFFRNRLSQLGCNTRYMFLLNDRAIHLRRRIEIP